MPSIPLSELIEKRFGRLVILSEIPLLVYKPKVPRKFLCVCDCGKECEVELCRMRSGNTRSCGCFFRDTVQHHGHAAAETQTPEYRTWHGIRDRCYREKSKVYQYYGARGITVCDRWNSSFENFLADMGIRPSSKHSIERLNVNGNYEPDNCIWATREQQDNNRRDNVLMEHEGKIMTLSQWARHLHITFGTIRARIRLGWTIDQIVKGISPNGRKLPPQGMKKPRKSKRSSHEPGPVQPALDL